MNIDINMHELFVDYVYELTKTEYDDLGKRIQLRRIDEFFSSIESLKVKREELRSELGVSEH